MERSYLEQFIELNVLSSTEACELLQVSRQRLHAIVKAGKLTPVKSNGICTLFLRSDIDDYVAGNKVISRHAPLYDYSGTTNASLQFFEKNISSLSAINSIYIYFYEIDAILNNFYVLDAAYSGEILRGVSAPHLIIRDINGQELWLGGCNCGYGGEGPRGTLAILNSLVQAGKIKLSTDDINKVFCEKVINIYIDDDGTTDIICRESQVNSSDDIGERARIYYCNGRIILLQLDLPYKKYIQPHKDNYELSIIKKYRAFIPNPMEVKCFQSDEDAINAGYSLGASCHQRAYKVIIIDSSGRELWLNPSVERNKPFYKQDEIKEILSVCGLEFERKTGISQKFYDWLDTIVRFVRPS